MESPRSQRNTCGWGIPFVKFNGDKGDKAKNEESARFMADIICIELGLNKRTKPSKK
jgi:hypothetical protein